MKINFDLKGLTSDNVKIESATLAVEYSVDEVIALLNTYKELIPQILAALKVYACTDE